MSQCCTHWSEIRSVRWGRYITDPYDLQDLHNVCRVQFLIHGSCAQLGRVGSEWYGPCTSPNGNIGCRWFTSLSVQRRDIMQSKPGLGDTKSRTWRSTTTVFAIYQILLGWKLENIRILLWNRPTPQPKANPTQKKIRSKAVFGPLFPTANNFSWVGIGFI